MKISEMQIEMISQEARNNSENYTYVLRKVL